MDRPYIICHMMTSIDGKVTGKFLNSPKCQRATEIYYELNRSIDSDGFICGGVTMEESFTGGYYPDLSEYEPLEYNIDWRPIEVSGKFAVAFDTKGRLGWKSNKIIDPDGDPGYDGAQIVEILSEQTDPRYHDYLEQMDIPYYFAGEKEIDVGTALRKLQNLNIKTLLLEGGSILNGAFLRANAIDELSLVVAPVTADKEDKPLFTNGIPSEFKLTHSENRDGVLILKYKADR